MADDGYVKLTDEHSECSYDSIFTIDGLAVKCPTCNTVKNIEFLGIVSWDYGPRGKFSG